MANILSSNIEKGDGWLEVAKVFNDSQKFTLFPFNYNYCIVYNDNISLFFFLFHYLTVGWFENIFNVSKPISLSFNFYCLTIFYWICSCRKWLKIILYYIRISIQSIGVFLFFLFLIREWNKKRKRHVILKGNIRYFSNNHLFNFFSCNESPVWWRYT